ncbi:MAG: hypothetical protein GYA23_03510 [Methanomicrobiales archaeon]|nr:hypothetical protein [Methanomicrobiales archaeon]
MKGSKSVVPVLFFLAIILITAGCTGTQSVAPAPEPVTVPLQATVQAQETYTSNETLVGFVENAEAFVKAHGATKALAEFNNPNGSFVRGELYIYAYGFNGTTLAHPINPETVGKKREGAIGVFVTEMGSVVKDGSGFYRFTYINPEHNRTLESKMGYGVKIDDDWWLGSGVYTGPVLKAEPSAPAATPKQDSTAYTTNETLVAFVDSAVTYAQAKGKEEALAEFSNPHGSFVQGELYIYAYDFNNTALAHPFDKDIIGKNRQGEPDAFGNQYTDRFLDAAHNGSGFVRFYYMNPLHNRTIESKLGYVKKVDDTWWVGSGIYTGPADKQPAVT